MTYNTFGAKTYNLAASISSTQTTITLSSFLEPVTDTPYTMALLNTGIVFATIAPKTNQSEFISFTGITQNANGTATLTGVTRGLAKKYPFTTDSAYKLPHSGQSQFIISNPPQLYEELLANDDDETIIGKYTFPGGGSANAPVSGTVYSAPTALLEYTSKQYVDGLTFAGAPDASTVQKGIVQQPSQAQVDARTVLGSTGAVLFVPPDTLRATKYTDAVTATGAANTFAIDVTPNLTAYATGQEFTFIANASISGACTLNVDGLGAKSIKKENGTTDPVTGDIVSGQVVKVMYDGTNMQMISPVATTVASFITNNYTAFEDIAAGDAVKIYNDGGTPKVRKLSGAIPSGSTTPVYGEKSMTASSSIYNFHDAFKLNATQVVAIYDKAAGQMYAAVCDVAPDGQITMGTQVQIGSAATVAKGCRLSDTTFAVYYRITTTTTAVIGTVSSGTTFSFGSTTAISTTGSTGPIACAPTPDLANVIFAYEKGTAFMFTRIAAVSGTAFATPGTENSVATANIAYVGGQVTAVMFLTVMSSTQFVQAMVMSSNIAAVATGAYSGTTISSYGTVATLGSSVTGISIRKMSSTTFISARSETALAGKLNIGTISGSSISFGSATNFGTAGATTAPTYTFVSDIIEVNSNYYFSVSYIVPAASREQGCVYGSVIAGTIAVSTENVTSDSTNSSSVTYCPMVNYNRTSSLMFQGVITNTQSAVRAVLNTGGTNPDSLEMVGIALEAKTAGQTVTVAQLGQTANVFTNRTVGTVYYIQQDGTVGTQQTEAALGIATSTTAIRLFERFNNINVDTLPNTVTSATGGMSVTTGEPFGITLPFKPRVVLINSYVAGTSMSWGQVTDAGQQCVTAVTSTNTYTQSFTTVGANLTAALTPNGFTVTSSSGSVPFIYTALA